MANRTVSVVLQAEIGSYVSNMTKAALATKGLGESADRSTKTAQKGFDLAGRGALLLGGAVAGALVGIVTKASEFEKAMSGVAAATQAPAAALAQLRDAAIDAGARTQYSATEAANAITELAKAGVSTADILKGGLTGALDLAAAGQLDVADAAQIAATAMTQFSLSGDQLPHVADLLAAGAGKAQGSVDDLGMALNQAGLVASQTGASIEETTGVLAAFASAGLIGSDAGTSLKTALQKLQAPSQQAAELMGQLGINAYDAQGNFVGFADLAGQLRDGLSGLTQAQRDSALATIFGSDAVRAANVLYSQGADGIDQWTKKVNDAGYASKQAHDLTDNLSGDLERLGGSFDTLLISLGSGAQGPLRDLVQGLGSLVDGLGAVFKWFSDLPGPVQLAAVAFAAWAIAGGKITSILGSVGDKVRGFREELALQQSLLAAQNTNLSDAERALGGLGNEAEKTGGKFGVAKAALGGFARAIGPDLAAAGAAAALSALAEDFSLLTNSGGDAKREIDDFNKSLGQIDSNSARLDAISQGIDDFTKKLADAKAQLDTLPDPSAGASLVGLSGILADIAVHLQDTGDKAAYLQHQIDLLKQKQETASTAASELASQLGISKDEVIQLADKYGVDLTGSLDDVYGRFLLARASAEGFSGATDNAASASGAFTAQLDSVAKAADDAKTQTDQFVLSLSSLTGQQVSLNQVESAYYEALDAATGALDGLSGSVLDNAGNLDLSTEAGRKTNDILTNLAQTSDEYIATLIEQGATAEEARAKDAELRQSFYETALQMTGSKEAAQRLTDSIFGIPPERTTQINADVEQAQRNIQTTQTSIDSLHGKTVTVSVRADGTVAAILGGDNISPFIVQAQAAGGPVSGPGGPTDDRAGLYALSDGEYVVRAASVSKYGVGFMEAVNQGRLQVPGYAAGGIVVDFDGNPIEGTLSGVRSAITSAFHAAQSLLGGYSAPPGPVAGIVQSVASKLGWGSGSEWAALSWIISHESGWRPTAQNPTSTAYGLFQFLNSTWASTGIGKTSDPALQTVAGLRYIGSRYGDPLAAQRFWQAHGYYEDGTPFVPQTGPAYLHQGEAVLPTKEAAAYRSGLRMGPARWSSGEGGGAVNVAAPQLTVYAQFGEETIEARSVRVAERVVTGFARDSRLRGARNG